MKAGAQSYEWFDVANPLQTIMEDHSAWEQDEPLSVFWAITGAMAVHRDESPLFRGRDPMDWRSDLWEFVRYVKGHADMLTRDADEALLAVEWAMSQWPVPGAKGKRSDDRWAYWMGYDDPDDGREEFIATWEKVKTPRGTTPLEQALTLAKKRPINWAAHKLGMPTRRYEHFLSFVVYLADMRAPRAVPLPTRKIGEVLGLSHRHVGRYIKQAVKDNILELIREAVKSSTHGRAAEYHCKLHPVRPEEDE